MRSSQLAEYDLLQPLLLRRRRVLLLLRAHHVAKVLCVHLSSQARAWLSGRTKRRREGTPKPAGDGIERGSHGNRKAGSDGASDGEGGSGELVEGDEAGCAVEGYQLG